MNCQKMETSLVAYLDRKANPAERRQVEAHLAECSACRERVEEFRSLWSALDDLPMVVPSAAFDAAVRERVAQEGRGMGLWAWLVPAPRMAFAVVALVVLSVWLSSMAPGRSPTATVVAAIHAHGSEAEFSMINNLPVLEDYDVLSKFDALSDLPQQPAAETQHPM